MKTVLVIDDDVLVLEAVADVLAELGYRVHSAASGDDGVAKAAAEPPTLILLDLVMPQLDGAQTLQKIRELPGGRSLSVVVMTAEMELPSAVRRHAVGMLRKPFGVEQLAEIVKRFG